MCWQENILLHSICDIVKTHAEENFSAYVAYCENQILIEGALKNIRYLFRKIMWHLYPLIQKRTV